MGLLLSKEERTKFADWCEMEAKSSDGIIGQMEKLKVPVEVIKRERNIVMACIIVANLIRKIEDG